MAHHFTGYFVGKLMINQSRGSFLAHLGSAPVPAPVPELFWAEDFSVAYAVGEKQPNNPN